MFSFLKYTYLTMSAIKYKKVFNKVCTISQEVANEISPFIYSGEEAWYQTALAYEFENNNRLGLSFSHTSNAGLGDSNPGTEVLGLYWHVPLNQIF